MASILLVDDDYEVLEYYAPVLRAAGYEVRTARDGEEAMQTAAQAAPDLIVADVIMPGVNGYQLCRKLKQTPHLRDVPVLLLSGKVDPADQYWARETGAAKLLPKPIDSKTLLDEIAALL